MWFPANPVLRRAGADDTIEDALTYFHTVVATAPHGHCRTPSCAAVHH